MQTDPTRSTSPADLFAGLLSASMTLGADLDLTLIDTRQATSCALRRVNAACGVSVDIEEFLARLGPPIREELGRYMSTEQVEEAVGVFRSAFLSDGLPHLQALPGAHELADRLRHGGGRLVVITSRISQIAQACLDAVQLEADVVVGGVSGRQKAQPISAHDVLVLVGDHPLDMQGAAAAGVPGIGVTTGTHDHQQLLNAGAAWTSDSLSPIAAALT